MTAPLFPFAFGPMLGVASVSSSDVVRVTFASPAGDARFMQDLPADAARAMANALYEAAEAAEAMPQAAVAHDLRGLKVKGSA